MSIAKRFLARFGLDGNSKTITNVADPVLAQDAATMNFASNASNLSAGTLSLTRLPFTPANKAGDYVTGQLGMKQTGPFGPQTVDNGTNSNWNPLAYPITSGKCLFPDEEFAQGTNSVTVYNNSGGSGVTHTLTADANAPNASKQVIAIAYNGVGPTNPGLGGFVQLYPHAVNKIIVQRFRAKVPVGYTLTTSENAIGTNGQSYWLTSNAGTGKYEDYIRVSHCGDSGTFSTGGYVYLTGPATPAITWYLASCTAFEVTTRILNSGDETSTTILNKLNITGIAGLNTGDETTGSIKTKLGITTLSGANTGDETNATILSKLGIPSISGANTGDETASSIKTKLGITTLSGSNTGDETNATILSKLGLSSISGTNTGDETKATIQAKLGNDLTLSGSQPGIIFDANGQGGRNANEKWRIVEGVGIIRFDRNTAAANDFSTYDTIFSVSSSGIALNSSSTPINTSINGRVSVSNGPVDVARGPDMASTATVDLLSTVGGNFVHLTGTTSISSIVLPDGAVRGLRIMSGVQFVAGPSLRTPGGVNLNTKPNDIVIVQGLASSVVQIVGYIPAGNYSIPDVVQTVTANTATTTLDLAAAAEFEVTLAASTSFVFNFANVPPLNNQVFQFVLTIINDGTAGRGVSFPAGTKWAGGQIPNRTTTANARDDWYFYSRDGVNWVGSLSNQDVR